MTINTVGGAQPINMISLEGLDLESMIMAVQTNRVNVMDEQIKSKMEVVQARNAKINELNTNMSDMNAAVAKLGTAADSPLDGANKTAFLAGAPRMPEDPVALKTSQDAIHSAASKVATAQQKVDDLNNQQKLYEAEVAKNPAIGSFPGFAGEISKPMAWEVTLASIGLNAAKAVQTAAMADLANHVGGEIDPKAVACTTRGQAEAYVKSIQTQIDSLGNTQQMDMLNLQSTSNKRNEAFEIMTNFMKKFNDSRAGIIQKF
jgi:hypothetical protein